MIACCCCWCLQGAVLLVLTAAVAWFCRRQDPPPIFGVYKQPGKWFCFKYAVFQLIFRFRQWQNRRAQVDTGGHHQGAMGYGRSTHGSLDLMDAAQPLSDDPNAFDAVFFIATNQKGYYLIVGAERRQHGIVNGLCYLLIPGKGLLCSRKIPDTVLFGAKEGEFGAEGVSIRPVTAMEKWRVEYHGPMYVLGDSEQRQVDVKLEADFCSKLAMFNYDTDLHAATVARSIAREDWTREYFDSLKEAHQTHYEQMGAMTGFVQIEGTVPEIHSLSMQAFRDHSYGKKRDWDLMHRYAFHMFFLEDGTMASIGVICQPCTCSSLETGFLCTPAGEVLAVEWCNLKLYEHGEGGTPPTDHMFQFKAGGTVYTVQVNVEAQSIHYVGWNWEARMVERFVRYNVNGVSGRGVSEFHYHNKSGRPDSVADKDPNWFQQVKRRV